MKGNCYVVAMSLTGSDGKSVKNPHRTYPLEGKVRRMVEIPRVARSREDRDGVYLIMRRLECRIDFAL